VKVDAPEAMRKGKILGKTKTKINSYRDKIEQNLMRTSLVLQISAKFKQDTMSQSIRNQKNLKTNCGIGVMRSSFTIFFLINMGKLFEIEKRKEGLES